MVARGLAVRRGGGGRCRAAQAARQRGGRCMTLVRIRRKRRPHRRQRVAGRLEGRSRLLRPPRPCTAPGLTDALSCQTLAQQQQQQPILHTTDAGRSRRADDPLLVSWA